MLAKLFLDHPRVLGESYLQHQRAAFSFALTLLCAGLAAFVHGCFPCLFKTTASRAINRLHSRLSERTMVASRGESLLFANAATTQWPGSPG